MVLINVLFELYYRKDVEVLTNSHDLLQTVLWGCSILAH